VGRLRRPNPKKWEKPPTGMPMKGLIMLSFYQKERITEQVRNDDAMKSYPWYHSHPFYKINCFLVGVLE